MFFAQLPQDVVERYLPRRGPWLNTVRKESTSRTIANSEVLEMAEAREHAKTISSQLHGARARERAKPQDKALASKRGIYLRFPKLKTPAT